MNVFNANINVNKYLYILRKLKKLKRNEFLKEKNIDFLSKEIN